MGTSLPRLVLVHGAWAGASAWDRVRPFLDAHGLDHVAIDLPGCGPTGRRRWSVSLADYGEAINAAAEDRPAVVVGHSGGGVAITQAGCAARTPHVALVYLAAYLLADGERLARFARRDEGSLMPAQIRPDLARGALRLKRAGLEDVLYHDYEGDDVAELMASHTLEPMRPGVTRVRLTDTFRDTPKYYVQCADDRAITLPFQQWMCSRYELEPFAVLECGHMPNFVDPESLADVLLGVVEDAASGP